MDGEIIKLGELTEPEILCVGEVKLWWAVVYALVRRRCRRHLRRRALISSVPPASAVLRRERMSPAPLGRRALLSRAFLCYTSLARSSDLPNRIALPALRDGDKRLYLVRHGETDWNVDDRIQGRTDNPLNANGLNQAERLSAFLSDEPLEMITSSDLLRAAKTADAVACAHASAHRLPGLSQVSEMCFGDCEGLKLGEFKPTYNAYVAAWRAGEDRAWPGPGGESPKQVAERGVEGLQTLGLLPGGPSSRSERHVCVVAHGRFNKILIAHLQGDVTRASDLTQGNTAINVLDFAPDGRVEVVRLNERGHLT